MEVDIKIKLKSKLSKKSREELMDLLETFKEDTNTFYNSYIEINLKI